MRLTIVKPHGLVILEFIVGLAIPSISSMSSAGVITYATSNFTSFVLNESHITDRPAFLSLANSTDQNPVGEIKPHHLRGKFVKWIFFSRDSRWVGSCWN
jgi:hypothetical protein